MSNPLFTLRHICKSRRLGPGYTLAIPHLQINAGERIGLTGPSGCGKSTALDLIGMVLRPDLDVDTPLAPGTNQAQPEFTFHPQGPGASDGYNILELWQNKAALAALRLEHMGYVLQTGGLLPFLTVFENMALTAKALAQPDIPDRVRELAKTLGIERLLSMLPGHLSIGERQRVAIGRALASKPRVLLADEPTAALDPVHAQVVLDLLLHAVEASGTTLILVTHAPDVVERAGLRHLHTRLEQQPNGLVQALIEDVNPPPLSTHQDGNEQHSEQQEHSL